MTDAVIGHGSKFARGDGATPTEAFTDVAEVKAINGISITKDTVDATHMGSTDRYEEIISSIRRTGEISVTLNYTDAEVTLALADINKDVASNYRVTFPGGATWLFSAHAIGVSVDAEVEGIIEAELTFKPSGKPTFTEAA